MINFLAVFAGGGIGSMLRYWLSVHNTSQNFPTGTFLANCISCLILGYLASYIFDKDINKTALLFFTTGFCGGFSTFSTFSFEVFKLMKTNSSVAVLYLLSSILAGVFFIWLGFKIFELK